MKRVFNEEDAELLIAIKGIIKNKKLDKNLVFCGCSDEKEIYKISDTILNILDIDKSFALMATLLALIDINIEKFKNNKADEMQICTNIGFCLEWLESVWSFKYEEIIYLIDQKNIDSLK